MMTARVARFGAIVVTGFGMALGGPRRPEPVAPGVSPTQLESTAGTTRPAVRPAALAGQGVLAFESATVIDVTDGTLHREQTVVITGSRITAVGPARTVRIPAGAWRVDARGKYLIPGLWDMHAHLWNARLDRTSRYFPELQYPLYVVNGITGIRSLNVPCLAEARRWRRAIAAGRQIGPRQVLSGPALDSPGSAFLVECGFMNLPLASPDRAQWVVDSLKAAGAELIKVRDVSREVYFAIAAAARRTGLPFGGHLPGHVDGGNAQRVSLVEALDAGQRIIDHAGGNGEALEGLCWDRMLPPGYSDSTLAPASLAKCAALAQRLRRSGTWIDMEVNVGLPSDLTPEMVQGRQRYWPDSVARSWGLDQFPFLDSIFSTRRERQVFALARQAGLPLLAGTDAMPPPFLSFLMTPGFSLPDVVVALAEQGLGPLAALQAATLNPAQALGAADSLGTVAAGKLADLVLLDGNPLADIRYLRQIRAVVANGRYFDRAALDAVLVRLAQVNGHSALLPPSPSPPLP